MKALVEKDILMKKQEKGMRKAPHFFYVHLSRELKGTFRYMLFVSKHQKINLTCMLGMGTSLAKASMNEYNKSLA